MASQCLRSQLPKIMVHPCPCHTAHPHPVIPKVLAIPHVFHTQPEETTWTHYPTKFGMQLTAFLKLMGTTTKRPMAKICKRLSYNNITFIYLLFSVFIIFFTLLSIKVSVDCKNKRLIYNSNDDTVPYKTLIKMSLAQKRSCWWSFFSFNCFKLLLLLVVNVAVQGS